MGWGEGPIVANNGTTTFPIDHHNAANKLRRLVLPYPLICNTIY